MGKTRTLPDEKCEECGKLIIRRARANLLYGRILCTKCYAKLAPTEGQLEFCKKVGIAVPGGAKKLDVSLLIKRWCGDVY